MPYGLRSTDHCFHRAHAQQSCPALIADGGNLGVTSPHLFHQITPHRKRGERVGQNDCVGHLAIPDRILELAAFKSATVLLICRRAATTNRSEEHTSELQSLMRISYAVFCLKKKKHKKYLS